MRLRRRYVISAGILGAVAAVLPAVASSETPPIEAVNTGLYSHAWSPAQASVGVGGTLTIRNSTAVPHGVQWVGGPATPECSSGVPVGTTAAASGTNWSGTCTFSKAGTYTFYCTVHGPEMTETVTVGAAETTSPVSTTPPPTTSTPAPPGGPVTTTPTPTAPSGSPLAGVPQLRAKRNGAVRGAIVVSRAGAGDRLEVDVLAGSGALGTRGHARQVLVGRLLRSSVAAGKTSFVIGLGASARRALEHKRRLVLMVRITVTPVHGKATSIERSLVARV